MRPHGPSEAYGNLWKQRLQRGLGSLSPASKLLKPRSSLNWVLRTTVIRNVWLDAHLPRLFAITQL